ncbi:hypothetical protein [Paenibacillus sp. GCM10027626]|uniref:hypothetical protein n=1 Tax=Paenibacillus sp. GCM10027626 TaxID=3273411 RepID=UPI00363A89C1
MIAILLWVLGCYALCAIAVHTAFRNTRQRKQDDIKHYILVAGNEQQQMEWYMRSLARYARECGQEVRVTIVDRCSKDDTIQIARCFARRGMDIYITPASWLSEGERSTEDQQLAQTSWMRLQEEGENADTSPLIWRLRSAGIVTAADQTILVDLQEPHDLSKLPLY